MIKIKREEIVIFLFCLLFGGFLIFKSIPDIPVEAETINEIEFESEIENIEIAENETVSVETCVKTDETEIVYVQELLKGYYAVPFDKDEQDMIRDIADMFGLEYPLVLAVMKVESDYNTQLIDDNGKSFGIMQVQPQWWQYVFETYKCTDWLNLHDNTLIGCRILSWGYERYEYDMRKALTWYNTGNPDYVNQYADRVFTRYEEIKATEYYE